MKPVTLVTAMEFEYILMDLSMLATICVAIETELAYYAGATGTHIVVGGLMMSRMGRADINFPMVTHTLANGIAEA
jgi:hypothetical protein